MPRLLPPHVAWPGAVVLLLFTSVAVSVGVVVAARSDGGAETVADYYREGATFDARVRTERASAALGWRLAVTTGEGPADGLHAATFALTDPDGRPVTGLRGTLTVGRPQFAAPVATVPLHETAPGQYRAAFPARGAGLYDLAVDARRPGAHYVAAVRRSLP